MRLVQSVRSGDLRLEETPAPTPGPTQVVVRTGASLISAGTERSLHSLASSSLLAKARARPDLVRQVIDRARTSGLKSTINAVRSRLSEDMPLGYSAAGEVLAVGEAVDGLRPGRRVATAGAPHADLQLAAGNLVVPMPDSVSFQEAAFTTVGSIALNALRLADVGPGTRVVVVGLGLVGHLTLRLASAAGALVAGVEPDDWKRRVAETEGTATFSADSRGWDEVQSWTKGLGADAVIVTAATKSSEPLDRAARIARDRGVIVLVGDVGMDLDRRPFYERELTLRVARSYGPGRYDPNYEDLGVDYPAGHVRWTAQRNMSAFLELVAAQKVVVGDLITHRFPFTDALDAYTMLESGDERYIGIVLEYDASRQAEPETADATSAKALVPNSLTSGLIGAGRFARQTLVSAALDAGFSWNGMWSATGAGAKSAADALASAQVVSNPADIMGDDGSPVVFIATRHDTHARFVIEALSADKHVFCEKPLALTEADLDEIRSAWARSSGSLMVGFNRRWSRAVADAVRMLGSGGALQIIYRINAGALPPGHWLLDRRMGGRLLGEACHFVDTCSALVASDPVSVTTLTSGRDELLLDQDFTLLLGYADGSQATIVYASDSSPRPGKERIEIMGRGRSLVIDDFHRLEAAGSDGRSVERYRPPDKGHARELEVFAEVVRGHGDADAVASSAFRTTRVMFAAVESAMTGRVVRPEY